MDSTTNPPSGAQGRRYFIAAGTAVYDHLDSEHHLPSVVDDLARMTDLFVGKLGYERALPELHLDPSTQQLRDLGRWLRHTDRQPSDLVVFYYSGHGEVDDDQHYLCTREAEFDYLLGSAFPTSELARMLNGSKVQQLLILLDTCYAGRGSGDISSHLPRMISSFRLDDENAAGIYVMAAAGPKNPAHSNLFSTAFIDAVVNPDLSYSQPTLEYLSLDAIIDRIKQQMVGHTDQRAELSSSRVQTLPRFLSNLNYNPNAPFSQTWLEQRLKEAIAVAGPRYTPRIHVELPIAQYFEALGRTTNFFVRVKHILRDIRKESRGIRLENLSETMDILAPSLEAKSQLLFTSILDVDKSLVDTISWAAISGQANQVLKITSDCLEELEKLNKKAKEENKEQSNQPIGSDEGRGYRDIRYHLEQFMREVRKLREFSHDLEAQLSNLPALLLCGEAGQGKTHLLCDIAQKRVADGMPTLLLMGQRFTQVEPWTQIIQQLGLPETTTRDYLLSSLQAAAQAKNVKALIMIDALNEGEGKKIWNSHLPAVLQAISHYPWISVTVSVRSTYEHVVIADGLVNEKLIRIEHPGFSDHEYQATRTFFDHFGIVQPSIPLLVPEFQNPLFLKLLCKGLKESGQTNLPVGLQGITAVFRLFIENVNKKLAGADFCNYNDKRPIIWRAIDALANVMADQETDWLSIEDAEKIINGVLPDRTYENSLYRHLISEGVIIENGRYVAQDKWMDVVQFAYERFSDHLIVKHLLDKHLNHTSPNDAFLPSGPLAFLTEKHWQYDGLIEALCIQLPERIGKEFPEMAPMIADSYSVQNGFIQSIIWRDSKAFTDSTRVFLNKYANHSRDGHNQILNALLTVATNPSHPYNADFLHRNLMKDTMADRDTWWSIFLHYQYGAHDAVDRLVDWAWSPEDKSHIDDESIRLCGVALAWFLTSSNRFLRDRATKALVNLFTGHIDIWLLVMEKFRDVNDLYVAERLYAVAYGCAVRSTDDTQIKTLTQSIYDQIFQHDNPPAHILLRDYARGVIEFALARGIQLPIELDKIRPPYQSEWPVIPSERDIEKYRPQEKAGKNERAQSAIYYSIMAGDFARYVIGTNIGNESSNWLALTIDEERWQPLEEKCTRFGETLPEKLCSEWNHLYDLYKQLNDEESEKQRLEFHRYINEIMPTKEDDENPKYEEQITESTENNDDRIDSLKQEITQNTKTFIESLSAEKRAFFESQLLPILNDSTLEKPPGFDLSIGQRWMLEKVFELGWTLEKFDEFDNMMDYLTFREANKPERIGKKYQWIAYHEYLARLADNFQFRERYADHPQSHQYNGTWQLSVRDIDPTCTLKTMAHGNTWRETFENWWFPTQYSNWNSATDDTDWMKISTDLPDIQSLIEVRSPADGSAWLALNGFYHWEQPSPPEIEKHDISRREMWFILHAYLIQQQDCEKFFDWAVEQNFMGRWMPEGRDFHDVFLGELYWSPAYIYHTDPYEGSFGWQGGDPESRIPVQIVPLVDSYAHDVSSFDCSVEERISIAIPTQIIVEEMELEWKGVEGEYFNKSGELIAFDPSVNENGPKTLLIKKEAFLNFLKTNGYCVVWTLLGEKQIIGGNFSGNSWKGSLVINGAYRWTTDGLKGKTTSTFRSLENKV